MLLLQSKTKKRFQKASTKHWMCRASCTVFDGKIVITGGYISKFVQAYNCYENKWTNLPDMNKSRFNHASVSMGNKLFVDILTPVVKCLTVFLENLLCLIILAQELFIVLLFKLSVLVIKLWFFL